MNVHERSRTVREQSIVREHVTLNEEIRKLSNKQTNKRCSRTVHEQIYKHQTLVNSQTNVYNIPRRLHDVSRMF